MALISLKNMSEFYSEGQRQVLLGKKDILTPSAKDFFMAKGVEIVYNESPSASMHNKQGQEAMIEKITQILINKYNITDHKDLVRYVGEILEKIQ